MSNNTVRMPSECNAAAAARSHYPLRPQEAVDWSCRLFDTDGYEHVLIDLGAVQLVTKLAFAYVVWDRRSGRCLSHTEGEGEMSITNAPLTDVQRHQRHMQALEALRTMYPEDDPRRQDLERSVLRDR